VEEEKNKNKLKQIVPTFFLELSIFLLITFGIYILFLIYVLNQWPIVQSFFMYFEAHSALSTILENSIISVLTNPNIQNISIVIAIGIAFFYLAQKIKEEGHIFFENEGIEGKYFKSLFIILGNISLILFPFLAFLFFCQRFQEIVFVVVVIIFNFALSLKLLNDWGKITKNYENLANLKSSGNIVIQFRDNIANAMIFLIIVCFFYCFFLLQFNLISIIFIELSIFIGYFIFCCVTYNIEGPVNIFLVGSLTIFSDAYVFEDSFHKGHIFIILKNNIQKKIMKSSILYMEPSDPNSGDPLHKIH